VNFSGSILLVDDEAHIRKYVALLLKQLGDVTIFEAVNGEDALIAYEREKPHLVLLDVNMPHMDGIETLRKLKVLDPACVVIMLTSVASRHTIETAVELGAANYIRKGTPKEEISRALAETIDACLESE